nr:choice-of-anchor A family protein [uncultured Roseateles sp.]
MNKRLRALGGLRLVSMAALAMAAATAQALPTIDFGVASSYSGFFFGDVGRAADVEGRLAVGGNLTHGFDIGYRNPYGATTPSLVVGGNVSWKAGTVYNGPDYKTDTNAAIGPWVPSTGQKATAVYGGSFDNSTQWGTWWTPEGQFNKQPGFLDFAAAKTQLNSLSSSLFGLAANGTVMQENSGFTLIGDGVSDLVVFNMGNTSNIANLTFSGIKAGAHVVINSSASQVNFSGGLGGDKADSSDVQAKLRDRLVFNLPNAKGVDVATFLNGSVLATQATLSGSGHLEGTVIANSLYGTEQRKLELGYEPFQPFTSAVPEPETYAMMLAGIAAIGLLKRRRAQANKA